MCKMKWDYSTFQCLNQFECEKKLNNVNTGQNTYELTSNKCHKNGHEMKSTIKYMEQKIPTNLRNSNETVEN